MVDTIAKDEMRRILLAYQKLELLQPATISNGVFINNFSEIRSPKYFTNCRVFLGIYSYQEVKKAFEKIYNQPYNHPEKGDEKLYWFYFDIDENGKYKDNSFKVSSTLWALKQLENESTIERENPEILQGKNKERQTGDYELGEKFAEFAQNLKDEFEKIVKNQENINVKEIYMNLLQKFCYDIYPVENKEFVNSFGVKWFKKDKQKTNVENEIDEDDEIQSQDLFDSFYLKDIEKALKRLENDNLNPILFRFFTESQQKEDLTELLKLRKYTTAKYITPARWIHPEKINLNLMQQIAVNLIFNTIETEKIFSINGPPGTGKTTILKDIIANIITLRALELVRFRSPEELFKGLVGDVNVVNSALKNFNIVVASANNKAVENVTKEIPVLDSVDWSCLEKYELDYFKDEAKLIYDYKEENNEDSKKTEFPVSSENGQQYWALISAVLGKKENREKFFSALEKYINELFSSIPQVKWELCKRRFNHAFKKFRRIQKCYRAIEFFLKLEGTKFKFSHLVARAGEFCLKKIFARYFPDDMKLPSQEFWSQSEREIHKSFPWLSKYFNDIRDEVFVRALQLHQAVIAANKEKFICNLERFIKYMRKNESLPSEKVKELWYTFFLIVPVVSTTLASLSNMFRDVDDEIIGWLIVDEAGQVLPQHFIGALLRSKRAIIVGDPLQIPPVVKIPSFVINNVFKAYGIFKKEENSNSCTPRITETDSVQIVADRASKFGARISNMWVGCPLRVHKRCMDPMFTVANEIAYNNLMIFDVNKPEKLRTVFKDSFWINVKGKCSGRHYVEKQGQVVKTIVQEFLHRALIVQNEIKLTEELFIISPFKAVKNSISTELKRIPLHNINFKKEEWEHIVDEIVGTIHSFQGKQANNVIICLGADENSEGAISWASSEPNILNVALTRAKYRVIVIGDKDLWGKHKYFDTLLKELSKRVIEYTTEKDLVNKIFV
ncbi:DEAD/DEAH box helicase [Anaerocellum danielii]|uniref:AAA domain-containing protein n=1 Tax=Anaerocellum danielii TaxID=1387557 RepID=A0ABZ0TXK6_9FIRM|nr:AAA domain-containing protein [Caldicellulosiruptor danielii]WPX08181.1 AAA domain-containing protein [Caldicellulosiruptor danielii]